MLAEAAVIGFIPVRDLGKARDFFGGKLGLRVVTDDGYALVLEAAGGVMIRCVLTPDAQAQPFTIFGWEVPDVPAAMAKLAGAGVEPLIYPHFNQTKAGVWTAPNGDTVAWFHDPDGNVLSVSHHPGWQAGGRATR